MTKPFTILITLIFIAPFFTHAQLIPIKSVNREEPRSYFSFALGASIPTGMYGTSDIEEKSSGYAQKGFAAQLNFGYRFAQYWGVCATGRVAFNGMNEKPIEDLYNQAAAAGDHWQLRSGSWTVANVMTGLYASVPFQQNSSWSIEPKAMIGVMFVTSPEVEYTVTNPKYPGQQGYMDQQSATTTTFGYCFGASIRKNLGDDFSLFLNTDYIGGYARFKDIKLTGNVTGSKDQDQRVGLVTITAGFGFRF